MRKNTVLVLLNLLCGFCGLTGQEQKEIDSLIACYNKAGTDSAKVEFLNKFTHKLGTIDPDKANRYGLKSIELAARSSFKRGLSHAYNNMGILHDQRGETDSAMFYYNKSLELARELKNARRVASTLSNIGFIHWSQGDFDKALDYTFKALAYFDTCSDQVSRANAIEHVGMIYYDLKDFPNSVKYHRQAIELYTKFADESHLANVYCNLALTFFDSSKDSMIYYLKRAETVFLKNNEVHGLGHVYNNIGGLYEEMDKPDLAIEYLGKAREARRKVADERGLTSTYITLSSAWLDKGRLQTAKNYADTAVALCIKTDMKENLADSYRKYVYVYSKMGLADSVKKYLGLEISIRNDLFSGEKAEAIADMQTKYDTEKKDLELARNKAELEAKNNEAAVKNIIIFSIIGLVFLLAIVAYLFYNKKRIEQQAKHDAELARQKEIRTKSIIETEEKERIRIAKDLHDGIGQLLSAAKMNLSSLEGKIAMDTPGQQSAFKNAVELLDESVKEVRTVSHNMMPNVLLKLGLASAIREFITKIQNTPDLKVNLEIVGMTERLEQEKESILYRVIQEIVSNIIKHAKASELSLQLIRHEKDLSIVIEDNGLGFDTSRINDFSGIGLKNIISRVEFINGKVNFDSTRGKGTTVTVDIPL